MNSLCDDVSNIILSQLDFATQLKLKCIDSYHNKFISSELIAEYNSYRRQHNKFILPIICKYNYLNLVKWFVSSESGYKINNYNFGQALHNTCIYNRYELFKFILDEWNIYDGFITDNIFTCAARRNRLRIMKYIAKRHEIKNPQLIIQALNAAKHLRIAKWIYATYSNYFNINEYAKSKFPWLCYSGNIKYAKWLHTFNVDINADNGFCFQLACENGQIDIAKWLYSININIDSICFVKSFIAACRYNHSHITVWLCEINSHQKIVDLKQIGATMNIGGSYYDLHVLFVDSCKNNYVEIAKLLYDMDNNVIRSLPFVMIKSLKPEIRKWLKKTNLLIKIYDVVVN